MAFVLNDRVKETSTTTGTGAIALGGAVAGFETFGSGIGNNNVTTNNQQLNINLFQFPMWKICLLHIV